MNFNHYDLGHRQRGEIVEITLLGNAASVRLMDSSNFQNYRGGGRYTCYGGLAKRSPVRLAIPNAGNWHVAIDLQGLGSTVRSGVRVLPGAMPELKQPSLSSVPSLFHKDDYLPDGGENHEKEYDVFFSHASEDKDEVVRPIATALNAEGLKVWYDEFKFKIGDSLRRKIGRGLANSKFGVAVLSKEFMRKGWTNYELDGIIAKTVNGEQVVLPIGHNITKKEAIEYSPSLADKLARNTSINTVEEIATEIAEVIQSN